MRRTLSKLRPMLHGQQQRKLGPDDFFIELNEPHRTFEPGQTVTGNVVVILPRDMVLGVSCGFQGSIRIKSNLVKSKGTKHVLFQQRCVLWGHDEQENERSNTSSPESVENSAQDPSSRSRSSTIVNENALEPTASQATTQTNTTNGSEDNSLSTVTPGSPAPSSTTTTTTTNDPFSSFKHFMRRPVAFRTASNGSPTADDKQSRNNSQNDLTSSLDNTNYTLARGEHIFAFEFTLPKKGLFNSLEFERGSISYILTAFCHIGGKVMSCKKSVAVICPIDVSLLPAPRPAVLTANVHKKKKEKGAVKVQVEIPQRGYLRGETVPVKISVAHIKQMRSLKAIIVTLSRISVVCVEGSEPQSFRKDLYQTVSPLYTDPHNCSAVVSTSMRIPTDTFPTTVGCPLVSFQYCIEAVIDLAGRWDSSEEFDLQHNFLDPDRLKNGKGVVTLLSEIIIGSTRNSNPSPPDTSSASSHLHPVNGSLSTATIATATTSTTTSTNYSVPPPLSNLHHTATRSSLSSNSSSVITAPSSSANIPLPLEHLSEKDRLRMMELALLPSEPPTASSPAMSSEDIAPMAPPSHLYHINDHSYSAPQAPYAGEAPHYDDHQYHDSPTTAPSSISSPTSPQPDKLELERLRLEAMQSAPPPCSSPVEDHVPLYEPSIPGPSRPPGPSSPPEIQDEPSAPSCPPGPSTGPSTDPPEVHDEPSAPPSN